MRDFRLSGCGFRDIFRFRGCRVWGPRKVRVFVMIDCHTEGQTISYMQVYQNDDLKLCSNYSGPYKGACREYLLVRRSK